ncbi:MAG: acyltransferase family protein [Synergistaceae bacterium]|nr:acyltransferase family protein [Synergistaceae bacterium]
MSQESGVRSQESGVRSQESGVRSQESGVRVYYFDYLRVLGAFAVIILHVNSKYWYLLDINSFDWQVINFYHGAVTRWAVPVYVMMSGALFLGRDVPLRRLYGKNILGIFTAFIFWSLIYSIAIYFKSGSAEEALTHFVNGHYHLWFLHMIIGLYMIVPFMKKVAESKFLTKYFLVLSLIFVFIIPSMIYLNKIFASEIWSFTNSFVNKFSPALISGYTGYFLIGYILNNIDISPKLTRFIYLGGIIGFMGAIFISEYLSIITNKPNQFFNMPLTITALLESTAIFLFCKKNFNRPYKFIRTLSKYTFGAYLVHPAVIFVIRKLGLDFSMTNTIIFVPVTAIFVFIISLIISGILNHIPVLNKYIV